MTKTFKSLLAAAALAFIGLGSLLIAPPAQASIICDEQGTTGTTFPLDGVDGPNGPIISHAFRCKNTVTGVKPTDARTSDLFTSLASTAIPNNVRAHLKSWNVRYFYFNNRTEANQYFQITAPYSTATIITPFVSTTSRCAQTGYALNTATSPVTRVYAVAIYDNCNYDNLNPQLVVQNPSVRRTAFHETGHVFDFTLAPSAGSNVPSSRSGFTTLFSSDKNLLTPALWSSYTTASKNSYICALFSVSAPSSLEKDLGATTNGGPGGQVCQTNLVPYTYYLTKTPTQIATEKLPYFMSSNQEIWAEAFAVLIDGNLSPAAFLPITDKAIGGNQSPVRSFNCVRGVVNAYVNTLQAPPATSTTPGVITLQNLGCNQNPGPL